MSGEHGDGLARSIWNRQAVRTGSLRRLSGRQDGLRPRQSVESRQGRRRARPGRQPPHRPRLPRRRSRRRPPSTSRHRAGSPAPLRCVRASGNCRKTTTGTMCPSYMVTRDEDAHDPRPRQCPPAGHVGPAPGGRPGQRHAPRGARPLPSVQGVQDRVPVERGHGQAQGRGPPPALHRSHPVPLGSCLMGHIHRLNPIGSATRAAGQLDPAAAGDSSGCWSRWPASTGRRDLARRSPANNFRKLVPPHTSRPPTPGRAARSSCWMTASRLTTTRRSAIAAVRVLEAAGYRVRARGAGMLRPAGDLEGAPRPGPRPGARERRPARRRRPPRRADRGLRAKLPVDARGRIPRLPPRSRCRSRWRLGASWSRPSSPIPRAFPSCP